MLRPRSASRTALMNCSAASRLSNTAAAVHVVSSPSMTCLKSGSLSRFQCASGDIELRRAERTAVTRVAEIHRLELHARSRGTAAAWAPSFRRSFRGWRSQRRCNRRGSSARRRIDAVYSSWFCHLQCGLHRSLIGDAAEADVRLRALRACSRAARAPARPRVSSPCSSQRVPTPSATTVSTRFSTSQTRRMISSVRSTGTLISTIADISFSLRMSSRSVPVGDVAHQRRDRDSSSRTRRRRPPAPST